MDNLLWERMIVTIGFICFAYGIPDAIAATPAYPALFAFGDSILDTGNNNDLPTLVKCNFPPYGRDLGGPTGRFCNGKVPTDIIATALGITQLVPAYQSGSIGDDKLTTGVSFASGGSGNDDLTAQMQLVLTLSTQLKNFDHYIQRLKTVVRPQNASSIISKGLYLVSAGNNDIALTHTMNMMRSAIPFPVYANYLIGLANTFLNNLYQKGARHVWVLSTLPLGCLPGPRAIGGSVSCQANLNGQAKQFNNKLAAAVSSLKTKHPDFDVRFIDVYNPMLNLIQNPKSAGFQNVAQPCCGGIQTGGLCMGPFAACQNPSQYFFWDSAHPTQKAYELTFASILKANNILPRSYHNKIKY